MKRILSLVLTLLLLCVYAAPILAEDERVTITWFQSLDSKAAASMQSMAESPTWQVICDKVGVNIEWIQPASAQLSEQFNLMIASRKLPDVIYYTWTNVAGGPAQLIDNGLLMDLTDIIPDKATNYNALQRRRILKLPGRFRSMTAAYIFLPRFFLIPGLCPITD